MMAFFYSYEDSRVTSDKPKWQRTACDDVGGCDDGDSDSLSKLIDGYACDDGSSVGLSLFIKKGTRGGQSSHQALYLVMMAGYVRSTDRTTTE